MFKHWRFLVDRQQTVSRTLDARVLAYFVALSAAQDTRKLSWKARARSHNSGLDDPLTLAFSAHASSPESNSK